MFDPPVLDILSDTVRQEFGDEQSIDIETDLTLHLSCHGRKKIYWNHPKSIVSLFDFLY